MQVSRSSEQLVHLCALCEHSCSIRCVSIGTANDEFGGHMQTVPDRRCEWNEVQWAKQSLIAQAELNIENIIGCKTKSSYGLSKRLLAFLHALTSLCLFVLTNAIGVEFELHRFRILILWGTLQVVRLNSIQHSASFFRIKKGAQMSAWFFI